MKPCRDCGVEKPLEDFHRQPANRDGRAGHCKMCATIRARRWYEKNQERARAINREKARRRRAENPDAVRAYERRAKLLSKYGVTEAEWDAFFTMQEGRCAICAVDLVTVRACVDHNHATGEVRGLLCNVCNQGLGYFGDDPARLRRAASYLSGAVETADAEEVMQQ